MPCIRGSRGDITMTGYAGSRPDRHDNYTAVGGMSVTKADTNITFPTFDQNATISPPRTPRGFMVCDAGTVKITTQDGSVLTFADGSLAKNVMHPISVIKVWSTGTSATLFYIYW